jgi:hypothetical protein
MNCSLVTPVIDLTGKTQANLTYGAYYYLFSGDYAKTEITTDGGATWTAIKTVLGYISGAEAVTIDLTAYVGGPIQIRFHYYAPAWNYYWEVDNVKVMADSTVMLFQNFDGATIPATWNGWWSTIISGTSTLKWQPVQTGTSPTCVPHTGSWMAKYPSYSISSGSARMMYNFSFDLTSYGSSDLAIGFWMMHDTGYAGVLDRVQVQVSTDNVTWVDVGAPINRYDATATTPTWKPHFVDISAYASETTVWIAFLGISLYGNNIYIDDAAIAKLVTVLDATPANNVKTKWILLSYEHDVGVSEITEPTAPHETGMAKWDSDTTTNAMSDGGYLFEAAIRFNVTDMIGFNGWDLKKVQFFKGYGTTAVPACSGNIKIYSSTNASQPETLETTEPWSVGVGSFWVNVTLSHPVNIQPGLDYWVSVEYAAGYTSYPAGCDLGPAVDFKGDWLWDEVTPWTEMQVWGFNYNWHIRAHFETVAPAQWLPGTYQVAGIVKNYGFTYPETNFVVNAKIFHLGSPDVLVYEENVTVTQTLAAPDGTAPVTFPNITIDNVTAAEGNYRVEIKTMLPGDDHPNNDKQTKTFTIFLPDVLPPITTHSFSGTMGDNDWYISDTSITLTATDPFPPFIRGFGPGKSPSGVNHTYYKVDAGAWTEYTQPVVVSTDGQHQVWYYSVDKVGNTEEEKGPFAFKIDKTAPVWTNYSFTPLNFMKNKWLCSAVVEDATSGVVLVEFYVDDALVGSATAEPWEFEFDGKPTTSSQGLAYDAAGNSALSPIASYVEYEYQPHSNPLQQKLI